MYCSYCFSITRCPHTQPELPHADMAQQAVLVFSCRPGLRGLVLPEGGVKEGELKVALLSCWASGLVLCSLVAAGTLYSASAAMLSCFHFVHLKFKL